MSRPSTIATWNRNPAEEEAMGAAHAPIWRRMIDVSVPHDLHASTVLDYGCNQGGFLRLLYDRHPCRGAVGIDIARESVARAELLKGQRPVEYKVADNATGLERVFDFAFSHEVIYLLPDIAAHARDIRAALRPGGRLVCLEFSRVALPWLSRLYELYSFQVLPALGAVVAGDADHPLDVRGAVAVRVRGRVEDDDVAARQRSSLDANCSRKRDDKQHHENRALRGER